MHDFHYKILMFQKSNEFIKIMENIDLIQEIKSLKKNKNAVILAHYYQIPEVQDLADFIGDSLALSQQAKKTTADIILFAGVHFMAETAKILNSEKKVIIPDMSAGCSLADSCKGEDLLKMKSKYPDHLIISYINCSAEIKCLSDIICTSGNALKIVNSIPKEQKILFLPDKNLGAYINEKTKRNMLLWPGSCQIHDILNAEKILKLKIKHPSAKIISHPECNPAVLQISDFIGSTAAMLKFIMEDASKEYIVATETGIIHQMKKIKPECKFYVASNNEMCSCNDCPYMKLNTLEKVYHCLKNETPEIILPKKVIEKAVLPIEAMLKMS